MCIRKRFRYEKGAFECTKITLNGIGRVFPLSSLSHSSYLFFSFAHWHGRKVTFFFCRKSIFVLLSPLAFIILLSFQISFISVSHVKLMMRFLYHSHILSHISLRCTHRHFHRHYFTINFDDMLESIVSSLIIIHIKIFIAAKKEYSCAVYIFFCTYIILCLFFLVRLFRSVIFCVSLNAWQIFKIKIIAFCCCRFSILIYCSAYLCMCVFGTYCVQSVTM